MKIEVTDRELFLLICACQRYAQEYNDGLTDGAYADCYTLLEIFANGKMEAENLTKKLLDIKEGKRNE